MPSEPVVYDKAKYHLESVERHGLDQDQAYVHTAFYFRWLLENQLLGNLFREESAMELKEFQSGTMSALEFYKIWDGCLIDDMLSDEGNAFSAFYFDFEKGRYLKDYEILSKRLPTIFHISFNEINYAKLKPLIDKSYQAWKKPKPWWKF